MNSYDIIEDSGVSPDERAKGARNGYFHHKDEN